MAATPDGSVVASVADDMVCRLWDVASGRLIHELRGHAELTPTHFPSMLFACAISPDGRHLATGDKVGHIIVWDVESGRKLATLEAPGAVHLGPGPAPALDRRHPLAGLLARRQPARRRRQRQDLQHRPPGRQGHGRGLRLAKGRAHARVRERQVQGPGRAPRAFTPRATGCSPAGGGDKDGFLMFFDLAAKKVLAQEKTPMYVHDLALNETGDTIYSAGHKRVVLFSMSG